VCVCVCVCVYVWRLCTCMHVRTQDLTSSAVPIAFVRVCHKCAGLDSRTVVCTKNQAKELFLVTDKDLDKTSTASFKSPYFQKKDSDSGGGSACSSSEAQIKVILVDDVKSVALKKHKSEAGLEAEFMKVGCILRQ